MKKNILNVGIDCCGCSNCANVCPKDAVRMTANFEGFKYPEVSSICVDCGICLRVCPQIQELTDSNNLLSFAAVTKDDDVLKNASSGGVFGSIAKYFLSNKKAFICAATFSNGVVNHIVTNSLGDIKKCQGSKYVQSDLGECFPNIKKLLKDGCKVLFCGTPCQVAALYSFLNYRPSNLFTLDLICHGVPSPKFFKMDIEHYCNDITKLKDLRFRWKNPDHPKSNSGFFLYLKKSCGSKLFSSNYDPYFASFMRGDSFRMSCYQCKYANLKRVGDITIGDFDSHNEYPNFHPGEGKSTVIINTSNGMSLWEQSKNLFDFIEIDLKKEAEVNHQLSHPFGKTAARDYIYRDLIKMSFSSFRKRYAKPSTRQQKFLFMLQTRLPYIYKWLITKISK